MDGTVGTKRAGVRRSANGSHRSRPGTRGLIDLGARRPRVVAFLVLVTLAAMLVPVGATSAEAATAPTVTWLTPNRGKATGGGTITVSGTNFSGTPTVRFGNVEATGVVVTSSRSLTAVVPPPASPVTSELLVGVTVTTPDGTSAVTNKAWYGYLAAPVITKLSATSGTTLGAQRLVIDVTNVVPGRGDPVVRIDGHVRAKEYPNPGPAQLAVTTPAHAAGPVSVTVEGIGGVSAPATFTYVVAPRPVVTAVTPDRGSTAGGTAITVTGSGFTGATGVRVGGSGFVGGDAAEFHVLSDTLLTAVTPSSADIGTVAVYVDTAVASSVADPGASFDYVEVPRITSMTPASGPRAHTTIVNIYGHGFTGTTNVWFGPGNPAVAFAVDSDSHIIATAPPSPWVVPRGLPVQVTVEHPNGNSAPAGPGDWSSVFTYAAKPSITYLSPRFGPVAGGTTVTIHGSGFLDTTTVRFGAAGAPAAFTVVSDAELVVTTPASPGPPGVTTLVNVLVTNPLGTTEITPERTFYYLA